MDNFLIFIAALNIALVVATAATLRIGKLWCDGLPGEEYWVDRFGIALFTGLISACLVLVPILTGIFAITWSVRQVCSVFA